MKRFYQSATIGDELQLLLDSKPAKTPKRKPLTFPTRALAEAVAAEWNAQTETIDPDRMPLTRLATIALDIIAEQRDAVATDTLGYAETDLLCYRADDTPELLALQEEVWDPVLQWARQRFDVEILTTQGIMPITQPALLQAHLFRYASAYDIHHFAALAATTHLTGSVILATALLEGELSVEQLFHAATLDEQHQRREWGETEEQRQDMEQLREELEAIGAFLTLLRAA